MPYSQPPELISLRNNYNSALKDSESTEILYNFFLILNILKNISHRSFEFFKLLFYLFIYITLILFFVNACVHLLFREGNSVQSTSPQVPLVRTRHFNCSIFLKNSNQSLSLETSNLYVNRS